MLKMLKYSATSLRRHGSPDPWQPQLPFAFPPSPHPSSMTGSAAAPLELRRTAAELRRTCHFTLLTLSTQDLSARSNRCCAELAAVTSSTAAIWCHVHRSTSPANVVFAPFYSSTAWSNTTRTLGPVRSQGTQADYDLSRGRDLYVLRSTGQPCASHKWKRHVNKVTD